MEKWKATEFRLFLLYLGPIVLKPVLEIAKYLHFLSLFTAIRLLCENKSEHIAYAKRLLHYYVQKFGMFSGKEYLIYKVHNLIHLADVLLFGKLDDFSAFKFENKFTEVKKKLKTSRLPLQQIYNRVIEESFENSVYPKVFTRNKIIQTVQKGNQSSVNKSRTLLFKRF